jgi:hypothetical protein
MREWLRETHGVQFELVRHFFRRFFDSEMIASPEQTRSALIGGLSIMLPWYQLLFGPLKLKYNYLSSLSTPGPYREALRADELWLITLLMAAIGLLTAFKWQALFPDLRDYRVLGSLPLRPGQIFLAKFLALLMVAAIAFIALTWLPSGGFPMLSKSRWEFPAPPGARTAALALATTAGCGLFFFGLLALQGVLLNALRPRAFRAAAGYLQGLLVASMLALLVMSFSIQPRVANVLMQPSWAKWLPPVWFTALCESRSGNPDPFLQTLGHLGLTALLWVTIVAMGAYAISYRRHRKLLVEGAGKSSANRRPSVLLGWLMPDPRQQGVAGFILSTLARSGHHRMILMGYGGLAFAVALSGAAGFGSFGGGEKAIVNGFVFFHLVIILALVIGVRHLFSLPSELKANWVFQLTERDARGEWLYAVDRMVLVFGTLAWILPLPLEVLWLGGRGIAEAVLTAMVGLFLYDWRFESWDKLPFTCSYVPGKTPGWMMALQFLAIAASWPAVQGILFVSVHKPFMYVIVMSLTAYAWRRAHGLRRDGWADLRLKYEDAPDPAVSGLNLLH